MKAIYAVPATLLLCYRAWSHKSLTNAGIFAAALTSVAHTVHPGNLPFALLAVIYLAAMRVTKIKQDVKDKLTIQSTGGAGEGHRTHIQVLANSGVASILSLLHTYQLYQRGDEGSCYPWPGDPLLVGLVANYAAMAADTFSSELGILSKSKPRLITSLSFREVPKGTNGGVTLWGLFTGLLGSSIIAATALLFIQFCPTTFSSRAEGLQPLDLSKGGWTVQNRLYFFAGLAVWGLLGSVLDSLLGGWLQHSVVDTRSGRIIEGKGGKKVLFSSDRLDGVRARGRADLKAGGDGAASIQKRPLSPQAAEDMAYQYDTTKSDGPSLGDAPPTRVVESGLGILDNNQVNFLTALIMSVGAIVVASWVWEIPLQTVILLHS